MKKGEIQQPVRLGVTGGWRRRRRRKRGKLIGYKYGKGTKEEKNFLAVRKRENPLDSSGSCS